MIQLLMFIFAFSLAMVIGEPILKGIRAIYKYIKNRLKK